MEALAERGEEKRETIFLMEDFPSSPNLVRKLIKLSGSRVSLSLSLSLSVFVCVAVVWSVRCVLQSLTILDTALNKYGIN